jgi:GTPase SAR1 family protein
MDSRTIKILVSCPGDVTLEKEEIKRLCKDFTDANHGKSNISFYVLDWKNHVGEHGKRPQQQLKEYFGVYDVYIGILWKRFGTKPHSIRSDGKENESGTEEEFYDAINYKSKYGRPRVNFFFKTIDRTVNDLNENNQLGKVLAFIEQQKKQNNNYLNFFDSNASFNSLIVKLLKSLEFDSNLDTLFEEKENLVSVETKSKIAFFKTEPKNLPETYIERSTSHFKLVKDKLNNPLLETKQQSLGQLMISTKRVVLLGDAGSGKSTELKNLHHRLSQDASPFVPILQNFNSYTPDLGLEGFLPEVPNNLLLIIWDGLDEIEPKNFNTVVRQIYTFSEKHGEIRILISCRTNFYELPINDSSSTLPGFEPYLINDLNPKKVKEYYDRKYSSTQSDNFISEIFENNLSDLIKTKNFN